MTKSDQIALFNRIHNFGSAESLVLTEDGRISDDWHSESVEPDLLAQLARWIEAGERNE